MRFGRRALVRGGIGCLGVVVVGLGFLFLTDGGKQIRTLLGHGFLAPYLSEESRKYNASTVTNLKALYNALTLYHESEDHFPEANGWMDALKQYSRTSDMEKEEADKKFVSPSLAGKSGEYGYAMNDAVGGKYKGDIKDPKTPLIFDSSDTSRNAHGDPKKLLPSPPRPGGNMAIAVDGTVLKL